MCNPRSLERTRALKKLLSGAVGRGNVDGAGGLVVGGNRRTKLVVVSVVSLELLAQNSKIYPFGTRPESCKDR